MTKHTPGPWRVVHNTTTDSFSVYTSGPERDSCIAVIPEVFGARTELANARVIAASLHMLEALTAAESALAVAASYRPHIRAPDGDRINAALTQARKALAKARGEP